MKLSLTERACPLCGCTDESRVFAGACVDLSQLDEFAFASRRFPGYMHRRMIECARCDLLYCTPAPTPQSLGVAYSLAAFDSVLEARHAARTYLPHQPLACKPLVSQTAPLALTALGLKETRGAELALTRKGSRVSRLHPTLATCQRVLCFLP